LPPMRCRWSATWGDTITKMGVRKGDRPKWQRSLTTKKEKKEKQVSGGDNNIELGWYLGSRKKGGGGLSQESKKQKGHGNVRLE